MGFFAKNSFGQLQSDFCILKSLILASRTCRNQSLSGHKVQIGAIKTIFSPLSSFFGFRIILLGRFNGQGLPPAGVEHLYRITKGQTRDFFPLENKFQVKTTLDEEYVKVIVYQDRGTVLMYY